MLNKYQKVLLIDDNEIDLKINSKLISLTNLFDEIIISLSGVDALQYLIKQYDTNKLTPTFILLDIQMPEMDGFEFLNHYNDLPKEIIENCGIVMLSSTLDYGDIKRAEASYHVIKLLKKPLLPKELIKLLK